MTIQLHQDVVPILEGQAAALNLTIKEAAHYLARFGTIHQAMSCEREMLIQDSNGARIYDYDKNFPPSPELKGYKAYKSHLTTTSEGSSRASSQSAKLFAHPGRSWER